MLLSREHRKGSGKQLPKYLPRMGIIYSYVQEGNVALYKAVEELMTRYPAVTIKAKPFDLSIKDQAKEFGIWCLQFGSPDILVNNAGLFEPGSVHNEADGVLEESAGG